MDDATRSEVISLDIHKYMSTLHLESSRLQVGDEGRDQIPYATQKGRYLVLEEKFDGGNSAVSFSPACDLLLQSRGHYLVGGARERQFNVFKQWARAHEAWLMNTLEDRYVMYGEWCHSLHAIFYDALPHYFLEFDVLDKVTGKFLSTAARRRLLADGPVLSVPVLYEGIAPPKLSDLWAMVKPSLGRTQQWRMAFERVVRQERLNLEASWRRCDQSELAEGLYGKVEEGDETVGRFKLVRSDFVQAIEDSGKHHAEQPFLPNQLAAGVDIFAPRLTHAWPKASESAT